MDAKKILLLILVVIAILTAMFFAVGAHRDNTDPAPREYKGKRDGPFSGLDKSIAKRFRDTFALARVSGCGWNGSQFQLTGECEIAIAPGKARSSSFELLTVSGVVRACFGFEEDQMKDCVNGDPKGSELKRGESRFVVSRDRALLRFYCVPVGNTPCIVRLSREE